MKLNPQIDADETVKYNTVPFLAWGWRTVNNAALFMSKPNMP